MLLKLWELNLALPQLCMYICFAYWAIGTVLFIVWQVIFPMSVNRKVDVRQPRDLLMFSIILAWLSMWCFRTMF